MKRRTSPISSPEFWHSPEATSNDVIYKPDAKAKTESELRDTREAPKASPMSWHTAKQQQKQVFMPLASEGGCLKSVDIESAITNGGK